MCSAALLAVLAAYTSSPRFAGVAAPRLAVNLAVSRASTLAASEAPFRSDDEYDYFRRTKDISVTLAKPLGATLRPSSSGGVTITELSQTGSANGQLKKGDRISAIMDADVSAASFDDVMQALTSAPADVSLGVTRTVVTRSPRGSANAGPPAEVEPSKLDKSFDKNFGDAQKTAKTLNKVAKITTNAATWKNPIYFWSVAGTALIFVPIIWYSVTKG